MLLAVKVPLDLLISALLLLLLHLSEMCLLFARKRTSISLLMHAFLVWRILEEDWDVTLSLQLEDGVMHEEFDLVDKVKGLQRDV